MVQWKLQTTIILSRITTTHISASDRTPFNTPRLPNHHDSWTVCEQSVNIKSDWVINADSLRRQVDTLVLSKYQGNTDNKLLIFSSLIIFILCMCICVNILIAFHDVTWGDDLKHTKKQNLLVHLQLVISSPLEYWSVWAVDSTPSFSMYILCLTLISVTYLYKNAQLSPAILIKSYLS